MKERTRKPLQMGRSPWSLHRVAAGVSMRQVATTSGLNRGLLSLLEQGRYVPSPQEAEAILRAIEAHRINAI
jgi:transcriptional regulator with XRE-family HTH domain